jgi:hypothetical protein
MQEGFLGLGFRVRVAGRKQNIVQKKQSPDTSNKSRTGIS